MALKHPPETPTKNLPETPPKTPKINPWTDHPGSRDRPTLNPGWGHPDPDLGLWMGHPESRGQSQTPYFVGFEGSGWPIQISRSGSGWPHPGFWVGPSWVPGWSVQGSILGVLGGVSREVFLWAFRPGVLVPLFGFFLSVSAFLSGTQTSLNLVPTRK